MDHPTAPSTPTDPFAVFAIGQSATRSRMITALDIQAFADVSGDHNPVHLDAAAARAAGFAEPIAHGMLVGACVSALLAGELPGPGAIYLNQSFRFVRPVHAGDTVSMRVEIVELFPTRRRLHLATTCHDSAGKKLLEGEAAVMIPKPRTD